MEEWWNADSAEDIERAMKESVSTVHSDPSPDLIFTPHPSKHVYGKFETSKIVGGFTGDKVVVRSISTDMIREGAITADRITTHAIPSLPRIRGQLITFESFVSPSTDTFEVTMRISVPRSYLPGSHEEMDKYLRGSTEVSIIPFGMPVAFAAPTPVAPLPEKDASPSIDTSNPEFGTW